MENLILSYYPSLDEASEEARLYVADQLEQVGVIRPILTFLQPKGRLFSLQFPVAEDPEQRLENLREASLLPTFSTPFGYVFFIDSTVSLITPIDGEDTTRAIFVIVTNTRTAHLRILPYYIEDNGTINWMDYNLVNQDVDIVFNNPSLSSFLALNLFNNNPGIPWSTYREYLEAQFFTFIYHAPFTETTVAIDSPYNL